MKRHVLIVDDEPDIREIAKLSLETFLGWEVSAAASGRDALEMLRAVRPDVILLDVMMPGLDGPATLRVIKADESTRDVPVLFLTAKTREWDSVKLDALGADGLIAKPFDPAELASRISELLDWGL